MRKLISIIAMFVIGVMAHAQVIQFEGNLAEAMAKAKSENKVVMLLGSATWCGPCKALEANVYPTKETGDLINGKAVFIKYFLDKGDPDNVAAKYNIRAYPTFVIIDADGNVMNKFVGGAADAASFNARVEEAFNPDNSFAAYEERMKNDISTGFDYAKHLMAIYENEKATKIVEQVFDARTIEENFNKESVEFYRSSINSVDDKIFAFILDKKNGKKVKKIMGSDDYEAFMKSKSNDFAMGTVLTRQGMNVGAFNKYVEKVDEYSILETQFIEFLQKNKDYILSRDADFLMPVIIEAIDNDNGEDVDYYAALTNLLVNQQNFMTYKDMLLDVYQKALNKTLQEESKQMYQQYVNRLSQ